MAGLVKALLGALLVGQSWAWTHQPHRYSARRAALLRRQGWNSYDDYRNDATYAFLFSTVTHHAAAAAANFVTDAATNVAATNVTATDVAATDHATTTACTMAATA